jgi:histidine ammonia-lyase
MGNRFFRPEVAHSLEEIRDYVKSSSEPLQLSKKSLVLIEKGAKIVHKSSSSKRPIYGINTGFGRLAQKKIPDRDLVRLQVNILRSHACGIGEPVSEPIARRLLVLRALSLGKGHSGVASSLVQRHLDYLNRQLVPYIPIQGSVGASGDLAPLAHLGLTFMGEGEFVLNGSRRSAGTVLKSARLKPLAIGPKEGLALMNGTSVMTAIACIAYKRAEYLSKLSSRITAMSSIALKGNAFHFAH